MNDSCPIAAFPLFKAYFPLPKEFGEQNFNLLYSRNLFQLSQAYLPDKYFSAVDNYL